MNILNKLTKNYLKLNKKRTIVTIIGIILSGAMLSAITTLAVSFQQFMIDVEIEDCGSWHAIFQKVKNEDTKYIVLNNKFEEVGTTAEMYMANNPYSDEQYLRIDGYDKEALAILGEKIVDGRMPNNSGEIVLSQSFFDNKENTPKVGDTITLDVGDVKEKDDIDDSILDGDLYEEYASVLYEFTKKGTKTYTICGIIERPIFENSTDYYTGGITLLDKEEIKDDTLFNIAVISKKPKKIYIDTEEIADSIGLYKDVKEQTFEDGSYQKARRVYNIDYNTRVLAYMGVSDDLGFNEMLYSVCGILIVVIIIGSVLVIYNSFAISVSERKKQFGMLSSVGATKKQIRKSVLFEGTILGIVGIPLGIFSGIAGISVTLKIVNNLLSQIWAEGYEDLIIRLIISWSSILIAVLLIAFTIYISALLPARRASKITPIEAIRQTQDIKVKPKKLKTPKFIRKLFGEEGEIALKNLKRSRKRYRTTVISLIISIVLYISVSGFIGYMFTGFDTMYLTVDYDYPISVNGTDKAQKEKAIDEIIHMQDITRYSYITYHDFNNPIPSDKVNKQIKDLISDRENGLYDMYSSEKNNYFINTMIATLDNETFNQYAKEVGIKDLEKNQAILIDHANLLISYQMETNVTTYKAGDKISATIFKNEEGGEITKELEIKKVTQKAPLGLAENSLQIGVTLIVNKETFNEFKLEEESKVVFINTDNEESINSRLKEISNEYPEIGINYYNIKEQIQSMRNLKLIIEIFLYGFIALISAIGIANIFNTISTNINLRRREFANLKSIGMTDKQFKKMLDLECIFYGTKALLYGLPLSIGICYLLNLAFSNAVSFIFKLPWNSIITAIIAVYSIVFITMLYSSNKVKKENIIDALREDNI